MNYYFIDLVITHRLDHYALRSSILTPLAATRGHRRCEAIQAGGWHVSTGFKM